MSQQTVSIPEPTQPPKLQRDPDNRMIAGVASGLAAHLGIPVTWVRLIFVLLMALSGIGLVLYAALWVMVPTARLTGAAGLEAATRRGMRPSRRGGATDAGIIVSVAALFAGVVMVLSVDGAGVIQEAGWPLLLAAGGVVLVWLQTDRWSANRETQRAGGWWATLTRGTGWASTLRLVLGLALTAAGVSWVLARQVGAKDVPAVLGAAAVVLAGIILVAAPWLTSMLRQLRRADQDRLRAEARADMAAHLHDSVLQTLALIQRKADDSVEVAALARRQERELRTWLYGSEVKAKTLRAGLEQLRSDIESRFPVAVEVVCVGDLELNEATEAMLKAAREATTNAAKHSGPPELTYTPRPRRGYWRSLCVIEAPDSIWIR